MKKCFLLAAAVAGLMASTGSASAAGGANPFGAGQPGNYPNEGLFSYLFHPRPVPAFQAAPWYLYWPYNGHFMTPAPMGGPFAPPPAVGGGLHNPYFPGYGHPGQ